MSKILYHGSSRKLKGECLLPGQGEDSDDRPQNQQKGVYAWDIKNMAIMMAIISAANGMGSVDQFEEPYGTLYAKFPENKEVYVHHLNAEDFSQTPGTDHQFISEKPIKPIKTETINTSDFKHLIRKATPKEISTWKSKYCN